MTTLDTWCSVKLPDGRRTRGRLVVRDDELLLLSAGPKLESFGAVTLVPGQKRARLADGSEVLWQRSCTCGQPTSLKGPLEAVLERVAA